MKKLLTVLLGIIVLVVIAFGVALLVAPTDFRVERDIEIAKPKAEVFAYIKQLKNQDEWGPWTKRDPNVKISYRGNDGEVGFVSKWESELEDLGVGEQEIMKIAEGERIDYELRFLEPFESKAAAWMATEAVGDDKTKVKWGFDGRFDRPMNIMLLFMDMNEAIGKDFDDGLNNLKTIIEKQESPKPEEEEKEEGSESEADESASS